MRTLTGCRLRAGPRDYAGTLTCDQLPGPVRVQQDWFSPDDWIRLRKGVGARARLLQLLGDQRRTHDFLAVEHHDPAYQVLELADVAGPSVTLELLDPSLLGSRQTLLNVTGFDQDTNEFTYRVNENVGRGRASGTPYQIQLGVRYSFN